MDFKVAAITAITVLAIVAVPATCTMHRQQMISDAIEKGGDPIAVRCALDTDTTKSVDSVCLAKAMSGGPR